MSLKKGLQNYTDFYFNQIFDRNYQRDISISFELLFYTQCIYINAFYDFLINIASEPHYTLKNMNTKVIINEQKEFDFAEKKSQIFLNNEVRDYEVNQISDNLYILSMKNQVHEIEILSISNDNYTLKIDGVSLSAELLDHQKQILKALGIEVDAEEKVDQVVSPMPGSIIEISSKAGDEVEKGTPLLILEAMKMENVIKSPAAGTVKEIKVSVGESVEKNQVLLVF